MGQYGLHLEVWGAVVIETRNQSELAFWLCSRIGLLPVPDDLRVIGNRSDLTGEIIGVVGYNGWNGASCVMHCAGEGNWITRELLRVAFDYPFNVANCEVVMATAASTNIAALKLDKHIGFKIVAEIVGAHPEGALVIMSMNRAECRYLNRRNGHHGQKISSTAASA